MYGKKDQCFPKYMPVTLASHMASFIHSPLRSHQPRFPEHPRDSLLLRNRTWLNIHWLVTSQEWFCGEVGHWVESKRFTLQAASSVCRLLCSAFSWRGWMLLHRAVGGRLELPPRAARTRPPRPGQAANTWKRIIVLTGSFRCNCVPQAQVEDPKPNWVFIPGHL